MSSEVCLKRGARGAPPPEVTHSAVLSRSDRDEDGDEKSGKAFADASDAPGLSKAHMDNVNNSTHLVTVTARVSILDPKMFEQQPVGSA